MNAVWANQRFSGSVKLTLLYLADRANEEGICWPGAASVCRATGQSRSTFFNAIGVLEKAGVLHVTRRRDGAINTSNLYRVVVPQVQGRPKSGLGVDRTADKGSPESVPESPIEPPIESPRKLRPPFGGRNKSGSKAEQNQQGNLSALADLKRENARAAKA
jgi:hypothetical protein